MTRPPSPPARFRRALHPLLTLIAPKQTQLLVDDLIRQTAQEYLPLVVAYRTNPLTYAIARRVVRIPHIGLVNIVAGKKVVPELLQSEVEGERIATETRRLVPPLRTDGLRGAVLGWDLIYYWDHRISHEMRFFWASHVNHHSSREFGGVG